MHFILELAVILVTTKIAGHLSVRLRQPAVLGELLIGVLIGPAVFGWVSGSDVLQVFSEIGVLLLMFIAGLETNLDDLLSNVRPSLAVALGGIVFPLGLGWLAGAGLGMDTAHAVFLGLILSATSVSITVQTLKELNQLSSRESLTMLGAAVLDDVLVIILLAFVMSVFGGAQQSLWLVVGAKLLFFTTVILAAWLLVPLVMRRIGTLQVSESLIAAALTIGFLFAFYAERLGVAGIIGAYIAGVAIARTPFKHAVAEKMEPIAYGVFVPVFFAGIGLHVTFSGLGDQLGFTLFIIPLAIFTKFIGAGLGASITGFNVHQSARIGFGMISRGEVALILASVGLEAKLLDDRLFTPLIIVVMLTTLVTPPLLMALFKNERGARQVSRKGEQ